MRFNQMLEQIVVLIGEVTQAQTNKRSAEIKALSAQMDPHFLYNTLNTIYWKLNLKQVKQSQSMVMSLSRLFQLGLNKGQEITTLSKELEHVRMYLELQCSCYEGLFRYEIYVEDEALVTLPIPRILLQPLVENSILHGFRNRESGG
ncbi:sensor histidine kinase [Paenibacillus rhizoplanae]